MPCSPRLRALFVLAFLPARLSAEPLFLRGNSDGNADIDIADPIHTLGYLFLGGPEPPCLDAADSSDSGDIDIADPIYTLNYLFLGGPAPLPPGPDVPGPDPTDDELTCPEPPPLTILVLLPGEDLPPGGAAPRGAGAALPAAQTAGSPFEVRVLAVDEFSNVVEASVLPPDLRIHLESPEDPGARTVPVGALDLDGRAIAAVSFTKPRLLRKRPPRPPHGRGHLRDRPPRRRHERRRPGREHTDRGPLPRGRLPPGLPGAPR